MGFREPRRTALITFEGTQWDTAEVRCRIDVPVRVILEYQRAADDEADVAALFRSFGDDILVEWNVEDDAGAPVPATGDGFLSRSAEFAMAIMQGWAKAAAGVSAPLAGGSPSGGSPAEESVLTAVS